MSFGSNFSSNIYIVFYIYFPFKLRDKLVKYFSLSGEGKKIGNEMKWNLYFYTLTLFYRHDGTILFIIEKTMSFVYIIIGIVLTIYLVQELIKTFNHQIHHIFFISLVSKKFLCIYAFDGGKYALMRCKVFECF